MPRVHLSSVVLECNLRQSIYKGTRTPTIPTLPDWCNFCSCARGVLIMEDPRPSGHGLKHLSLRNQEEERFIKIRPLGCG